jgi:D-alanine transaminase
MLHRHKTLLDESTAAAGSALLRTKPLPRILRLGPGLGERRCRPMSNDVWINGEVVPRDEARIDVEDRGFQFADGVYEVFRIYNGKPFTLDRHLARLERSAEGFKIPIPLKRDDLARQIRKFITDRKVPDGYLYLQLTRGVALRDHRYPKEVRPTLLFYVKPLGPAPVVGQGEGLKLLPVEDERWHRCWIKAIALIANVLAKNEAVSQGYDEAVFVSGDIVTECATSNLFAAINGKLVTHPVGSKVLPGITRAIILDCAAKLGIAVEERSLRVQEVARADELFISSTTRELAWVARWNDRYIGQAKCGAVTMKLHHAYRERVIAETG